SIAQWNGRSRRRRTNAVAVGGRICDAELQIIIAIGSHSCIEQTALVSERRLLTQSNSWNRQKRNTNQLAQLVFHQYRCLVLHESTRAKSYRAVIGFLLLLSKTAVSGKLRAAKEIRNRWLGLRA